MDVFGCQALLCREIVTTTSGNAAHTIRKLPIDTHVYTILKVIDINEEKEVSHKRNAYLILDVKEQL